LIRLAEQLRAAGARPDANTSAADEDDATATSASAAAAAAAASAAAPRPQAAGGNDGVDAARAYPFNGPGSAAAARRASGSQRLSAAHTAQTTSPTPVPWQLFFSHVHIDDFHIIVDFFAKQKVYSAVFSRLRHVLSAAGLGLSRGDGGTGGDEGGGGGGGGGAEAAGGAGAGEGGGGEGGGGGGGGGEGGRAGGGGRTRYPASSSSAASASLPSVLYWIPTVRGVKVSVPRSILDSCYGITEVVQQWLDAWARYLLQEDLLNVAASLAIGLAGYSGADSIDTMQTALKQLRLKVHRMM
jgi:hypothetical protein